MILKIGSRGYLVKLIQSFLIKKGFLNDGSDGIYGRNTRDAVKKYQVSKSLSADGIVGQDTISKMIQDGLNVDSEPKTPVVISKYPSKPYNAEALTESQKVSMFGRISWKARPLPGNKENIIITNGWDDKNIDMVSVPQLIKLGLSKTGNVSFNKKCIKQMLGLWKEWDDKGFLKYILTYDGSYNPRLIRGSKSSLSNHAFGTAQDINAEWNMLGRTPARKGSKGCVYDLVESMYKWGFFWGGHFSRKDGMHFEVYKIL